MEGNSSSRPSKASLIGLMPDLLLLILDCLAQSDLQSLCLANSKFTRTAQYTLHGTVTLSFDSVDPNSNRAQEKVSTLETSGLLPAVRKLKVSGPNGKAPNYTKRKSSAPTSLETFYDLVEWCIAHMTGLQKLSWQGPGIPVEVLFTLRRRPQVKLYMTASAMRRPTHLRNLKSTSNLYSVEVDHRYWDSNPGKFVTKPLRQILLSCPNVRRLKLNIDNVSSDRTPRTRYHGMGFRKGERPPPLEELELGYYPFGYTLRTLANGNFEGYPAGVDEDVYWAETFDWSRLRKLKTIMCGFVIKAAPFLLSLEDLILGEDRRKETLTSPEESSALICALPVSLRSIEVDHFHHIGWEGLVRHATTLRELRVHTSDRRKGPWSSLQADHQWDVRPIPDPDLVKLRDLCPHLSTLAIDMARSNNYWPWGTFDILASFPSVRILELHFELTSGESNGRATPYLTFSASAKLFQYLRTRNPSLRQLILHVGSPPDGQGASPMYLHFPLKIKTTFECYVAHGGDGAGQYSFVTTCTGLESKENAALRRVLARYPDGTVKLDDAVKRSDEYWDSVQSRGADARHEACKLAWDGVLS